MSVIDSSLKFVGINPDFPTAERKSAQVNAAQEVVTMQDIIDTVNDSGVVPTLQEVLDNNHDLVDGNNFQGTDAGRENVGTDVIALGTSSAKYNEGSFLNAIGWQAGYENTGDSLIAIGKDAGNNNKGAQVIALGTLAAKNNEGDDVFVVGQAAGQNNSLSNQFIIANSILPSYANYAAASTAISADGSADCTYMFYDESDHIIKGIRL
jgi:hypothetical protein